MVLENLVTDLRFAFRTLAKTPMVTAVAIASLALGIAANTTIFSMLNAVFLRSIPVGEPERIAVVFTTDERTDGMQQFNISRVSRPNFEALRDENDAFESLTSLIFTGASLATPGGEPIQIGGELVTSNYFEVFGVEPVLGRAFRPEEDRTPGGHPVVILSHEFWNRQFGAEPSVIGETITLNAQPFTIVGVGPPGFRGAFVLGNPNFWAPSMMYRTFLVGTLRAWFENRRAGLTSVYGRLKPGVTIEQAEASLRLIGESLEAEYPQDNEGRNFALQPLAMATLPFGLRENFVQAGGLLMTVVALVLLIACANVANLLLGRAAARRKELAIRLSMGASRSRLVRQLLTESTLLALVGGGFGLLLAFWMRSALWSFRPPFLQQTPLDLGFDGTVLGFALVVTLVTGVLFGLAPALQASSPRVASDLKPQAARSSGFFVAKDLVVTGQIGLSLVALIGSALFLKSLHNAMEIDTGFETERLASMAFDVASVGYEEPDGEAYFDRILERARAVPGVESAALTTGVPMFNGITMLRTFIPEDRPDAEDERTMVPVTSVSVGYFRTAGIRLVAGRDFSSFDHYGSPRVAVVNETTAARFWPEEDPIGKRFHFIGQEDNPREIVGVTADSKYQTLGEEPQTYVYLPRRQEYATAMSVVIRARGDPESIVGTVRNELQPIEPRLAITAVQTMPENLSQSLWPARTSATLLGILGAVALLMASIGIYGVMSYTIARQSREIGLRMALGGSRGAVLAHYLKRGMVTAGAGGLVGLAAAALLSRSVSVGDLLYDVDPLDPMAFALTALVLFVVAMLANLLPARRATRVDPAIVLKEDQY